ncbi:MAG: CehA/McbA family metallohydrolase [Mariniphaga sp.]|nr:CehA/McbA family metallohydrolase [Mariniphaga sp.]
MKRRNFFKLAGISAASTLVPSVFASGSKANIANEKRLVNPFTTKGKWYKAALHVHTTTSDGDVDVPTRIRQYKDKGFDIVSITDHRKTNDLSDYSSRNFLAISGIEFHPDTYSGAPAHHLLGIGLPHPYHYDNNMSAQEIINDIKNKGAKVFYAHPYWTGHTFIEMSEVSGYIGVEVHNEVCEGADSGNGRVHWDQMLNNGYILSGLATDDVHKSDAVGKAWTMIKAEKLNEKNIIEALETGCFYASKGPEIEKFIVDEKMKVSIKCSPVQKIVFRTSGSGNGNVIWSKDPNGLTSAVWDLTRKKPKWVRCEVTDKNGNTAWTNPIFIDNA